MKLGSHSNNIIRIIFAVVTILTLPGCGEENKKNKEDIAPRQVSSEKLRSETVFKSAALDNDKVQVSLVKIYSPLSIPNYESCDWINYLRFKHVDGPATAPQADAVVVGMPGLSSGAGLYDQLARNTIKQFAAEGKFAEFWAVDRRANCVEDLSGIKAGVALQDYKVAIDYYYNGREINGKKYNGFLKGSDVPFLAEFGLKRTVEDLYQLMKEEMPILSDRKEKLFCGGHSMGGPIMAAFTMWDFDGDKSTIDDAGFNQCRGFFALDTSYFDLGSRLEPIVTGLLGPLSSGGYDSAIDALRTANSVFLEVPLILDLPKITNIFTIAGLAAYSKPNEETELFKLIPKTSGIALPLRLLYSRDLLSFITGVPKLSDFRMTNEAALGTLFDDNSSPIFATQASLGTFDGGPVVQKRFPFPANDLIALLPGIGPRFSAIFGGQLMMPAIPNGPLYKWRSSNMIDAADAPKQVGDFGKPYTSPNSEVTDIKQFARSLHEAPLDAFEAYFPTRLLLDTFFFSQIGIRTGDLAGAIHPQGLLAPISRPYIGLQAADGFATNEMISSESEVILPGYNHFDVATAAADQNTGENELVSSNLVSFMLKNLNQ